MVVVTYPYLKRESPKRSAEASIELSEVAQIVYIIARSTCKLIAKTPANAAAAPMVELSRRWNLAKPVLMEERT